MRYEYIVFYFFLRFFSVIPRLDRGIQRKELDFPVKPENDNHWNRVC